MTYPANRAGAGPFRPAPWLPGRHLQTIVPSLWPAPPVAGRAEPIVVPVDDASAVRLEVNRPSGASRGTLLLIHGMGGSAESGYMRRTASPALARRWTVARMNLRNCGGTELLATTLYNAGQGADVGHVLAALEQAGFPRPFAAAGFSLGGNILLRHAGEQGRSCRADAVAAVNPPIDLESCAAALERRANRVYQAYYTGKLLRDLRRILAVRDLPGCPAPDGSIRTVRRFDELYTAPDAGYASAEEYYAAASAGPRLTGLSRPALVLSAADDPFVPVEMFEPYRDLANAFFLHPRRGGHCGYWRARRPHYWAAEAILRFYDDRIPPRSR